MDFEGNLIWKNFCRLWILKGIKFERTCVDYGF